MSTSGFVLFFSLVILSDVFVKHFATKTSPTGNPAVERWSGGFLQVGLQFLRSYITGINIQKLLPSTW